MQLQTLRSDRILKREYIETMDNYDIIIWKKFPMYETVLGKREENEELWKKTQIKLDSMDK